MYNTLNVVREIFAQENICNKLCKAKYLNMNTINDFFETGI